MAEASRAFSALGFPDNLNVAEATYAHGYLPVNREALYNFFCQHLPSVPAHPNCGQGELPIPVFTHEQLWATTTGQVVTDPTVQSLIVYNFTVNITRDNLRAIINRRAQGVGFMIDYVRSVSLPLSGFVPPTPLPPISFFFGDQIDFSTTFVNVSLGRKWILESDGKCRIPLIQYIPANVLRNGKAPTILLFTVRVGSTLLPQQSKLVDALAGAGAIVIVADLCGFGEVGYAFDTTSFGKGNGGNEQMATELGGSIPGFHAAEIHRIVSFVNTLPEVANIVATIAFDQTMTAVLLASIFGSGSGFMGKIALVEPIASFSQNAVGGR